MLKDITLGQYYPADSIIHKMDPRTKIILTVLYIVMIFMAKNIYALGISVIMLFVIAALAKIPLKMIFRSIKAIIPVIIITSVLNIFYVSGEVILLKWRFITVTREGLITAGFIIIRIVTMIAGSSIMTFTTTPTTLTDGIERLIKPLKLLRINVHDIAMMMTIALRFVPTLIEETDRIINAQKSRGADMTSGGIIKRTKALLPVFLPLLISAFTRARDLATAMECRCYTGVGRTRMKVLKYAACDYASYALFAALTAGVVLCNVYLHSIISIL